MQGIRKQPIFVVGCSRSGTTIVQACLAASEYIFAFPETHLPFGFFLDSEDLMFDEEAREKGLVELLKTKMLKKAERSGICRVNFPYFINKAQERHFSSRNTRIRRVPLMKRAFQEYRSAAEAATSKSFWAEKSPRNIFIVDWIEKYISDALFIHVVRQGEDTVASLVDAGRKYDDFASRFGGKRGVERACDYWNKAIAITSRHARFDRHYIVHYENFIKDPEWEMRKICSFLGVPFSCEMTEPNFEAVRDSRETWKFSYGDKLSSPASKFEKLTTAEQNSIKFNIRYSRSDLVAISCCNELLKNEKANYASKGASTT